MAVFLAVSWLSKLSPNTYYLLPIIINLDSQLVERQLNKKYKINSPDVYLFGSSFGGPAAILASKDKRVKKAMIFSPVIDWKVESKIEPIDWMGKFTREAFGNGYRFSSKDWNKLKSGKFYNPISEVDSIDGKKLFIIHAKDDDIVYSKPSEDFAEKTGCRFILLKKGGHLPSSLFISPRFWKEARNFFKE